MSPLPAGLPGQLRARGVERLLVCGLATDYCVLKTVLDGRANGFELLIAPEAMRAVEVEPGDGERALARMREHGARAVRVDELTALGRGVGAGTAG